MGSEICYKKCTKKSFCGAFDCIQHLIDDDSWDVQIASSTKQLLNLVAASRSLDFVALINGNCSNLIDKLLHSIKEPYLINNQIRTVSKPQRWPIEKEIQLMYMSHSNLITIIILFIDGIQISMLIEKILSLNCL